MEAQPPFRARGSCGEPPAPKHLHVAGSHLSGPGGVLRGAGRPPQVPTERAFCPESPALLRAVSRRAGKTDDSGLMASTGAPTRPPGDVQAGEGSGGAASGGRVSLSVPEIQENKDSRDREKASAGISVATSGAGASAQGEGTAPPTADRGVRAGMGVRRRRGRGGHGGRFGRGNTMASKGDAPAKPSVLF